MSHISIRGIAAVAALGAAAPALADGVTLASSVMVERTVVVDGRSRQVLQPPRMVTPGDRLAFTITYRNTGEKPVSGFVATNPLPASVAFSGEATTGAVVSVDRGASWGPLATLTVATRDGGRRPAQADDVTHVRWTLATPVPAGGGGVLTFRGVVR